MTAPNGRRRGLNVGCGKLLRESTEEIEWDNTDVVALPGVAFQMDAFRYPWPLPSGRYDELYAGHLVEHIPHAFTVQPLTAFAVGARCVDPDWLAQLRQLPDGFFAWFAEAWRVLKMGGTITCEVPWGLSMGAIQDPGHTRSIVTSTLSYLCNQPSESFDYRFPARFEVAEYSYAAAPEYEGLSVKEVERLANKTWNVIHLFRFTLKKVPLERGAAVD